MVGAIDANIQKFFKGFTTGPGQFEDPTYLGFKLFFNFDDATRNPSNGLSNNALWAAPNGICDSAQYYLQSIGMPNRALMLQQFKDQLRYIVNNTPWYFQTLEGLADIWDIPWGRDGWNTYRGKDKRLTIGCLESIDMRMTALADLYRKATFDPVTMRSLLPDNLRWFTLTVYVFEIRKFQKVANTATALGNMSVGNAMSNAAPSSTSTTGGQSSSVSIQMQDITNLISMVSFEFSKCEFDFNQSFPVQDAINMGTADMSMAKSMIKIETHHIEETNQYTLLNLILEDGPGDHSQVGGSYFSNSNVTSSNNTASNQKQMTDLDSALNPYSTWSATASKLDNIFAGQSQGAGGVASGPLGNVYSLSLLDILESLVEPVGENALTDTPPNPAPLTPNNVLTPPPPEQPLTPQNVLS